RKAATSPDNHRSWSLWRGADLRRRGNHAGDFGALGVRGAGTRATRLRILCSPNLGSDPCGAVRHPTPRYFPNCQGIQPDYGTMVSDHRATRDLGHFPKPLRPLRDRSVTRVELSDLRRSQRISFARRSLSMRYRRADLGHFGARPIKLAWSAVVFPSLVLN